MAIDTIKKMMGGPGTTGTGSSLDKLYGNPNRKARVAKNGGKKGKGKGIAFYMGDGKKK